MLKSYKFFCGGLLIALSLHEQTTDRKYLSEEGHSLLELILESKNIIFKRYFLPFDDLIRKRMKLQRQLDCKKVPGNLSHH